MRFIPFLPSRARKVQKRPTNTKHKRLSKIRIKINSYTEREEGRVGAFYIAPLTRWDVLIIRLVLDDFNLDYMGGE